MFTNETPHLTPAYGRDYTSQKAVLADWNAGKDFLYHGRPFNLNDALSVGIPTVNIRYHGGQKIMVVPVKKPKPKAPKGTGTFQEWLRKADRLVLEETGMSVHDFVDAPWNDAWKDGLDPREALEFLADHDDIAGEFLNLRGMD